MKGISVYVREKERGEALAPKEKKRVIMDKIPMYYFLAKYTGSKSQSYTGSIYKLLELRKINTSPGLHGDREKCYKFLDLDFDTSLHQANKL